MPRDNICMYMAHVCFYICCSDCVGACWNVYCVAAVVIVSKDLLISSATVIVRAGGAIWLNPFATVLCFVPVLHECVWYVCCYVMLLLRGGIWACMKVLGYYVNQLPCVRYYVCVKSRFKHTRDKCKCKRVYVFYVPDI